MKILLSLFFLLFTGITLINNQMSCEDLIDHVESEDWGTTYRSYDSDAISSVSFHSITDDSNNTYYFAIVKFTSSYQKYIYQVDSDTQRKYSRDRYDSAGEAFWEHIHPYRRNLGCAPEF